VDEQCVRRRYHVLARRNNLLVRPQERHVVGVPRLAPGAGREQYAAT